MSTTPPAAASTSSPAGEPPTTATPTSTDPVLAGRPFDVFVPSSYTGSTPVPLVVLLHGYTATGDLQEAYFGVQPLAEARGFLYVHPNGTTDARGSGFWNATDACCNLFGADVDDVAYLTALIESVRATYDVDPKRIFLLGHSNGGFMSYRMACERSGLVAAIATLAGASYEDAGDCAPSEPVSVLQIHGTADAVVSYRGGEILGNTYPAAEETVADWAGYDGCATEPMPTDRQLDLDLDVPGAESSVSTFGGCPTGIGVELWTIDGGSHIPRLAPEFTPAIIDFLLAHPKP